MTRYRRSEPITPLDATALAEHAHAIYVGGAGDLTVHMVGDPAGVYRTFKGALAGEVLDIEVDLVRSTATTATYLLALRTGEPYNVADLTISGTPVTTATKDSPYAGFTVSGAGGLRPYAFSVAAGALPTGMTLNATTGAVAGTPTALETKTGIVIRVTDANGDTADLAAFSIDVTA